MSAAEPSATCYHCGLPIVMRFVDPESQRAFCCHGCLGVYQLIEQAGDGLYYQQRDALPATAAVGVDNATEFDLPALQSLCTRSLDGGRRRTELFVEQIHCAACAWLIEAQLGRLTGVLQVRVNVLQKKLIIDWHAEQQELSSVVEQLGRLGYGALPWRANQRASQLEQSFAQLRRATGIAGLLCMQVGMLSLGIYTGQWQGIDPGLLGLMLWASGLLATLCLLLCSTSFFRGALLALRQRRLNMDVPVALAITLAYIASVLALFGIGAHSYFDSVVMFTFLLLLGRWVELGTRQRVLETSADVLPESCTLVSSDQGLRTVACRDLRVGDVIQLAEGAMAPRDATLLSPQARFDESAFTGESAPVSKVADQRVLAGTLNSSGQSVLLRVSTDQAEDSLARVRELIDRALTEKPLTTPLIDRLAGAFLLLLLFAAILGGLLQGLYWQGDWLSTMVAVLIVSCPCALTLATPVSLSVATAALRRSGVVVTQASTLPALAEVTDAIFDKTGTLTRSQPQIAQCLWQPSVQHPSSCLATAIALQSHSTHPVARAFLSLSASVSAWPELEQVRAERFGVQARHLGQTYAIGVPEYVARVTGRELGEAPSTDQAWRVFASSAETLAWFYIEEGLRPEAASVVVGLQRRGVRVHLLSGDQASAVSALAKPLNLDAVLAEQSPAEKLQYLQRLQADGRRCLMIGDGINDVPVSSAADVSIGVSGAVGLLKANADALLLNEDLLALCSALDMARFTQRVVRQNIAWALLYNLSAIPLAVLGWVPPWAAAIGMSASSLVVLINARRLQRVRVVAGADEVVTER